MTMMCRKPFVLLLALLAMSAGSQASVVYQCVDEQGYKTFSNIKLTGKGVKCTAMDLGETAAPAAPAAPAPKASSAKAPSPAGFPKVDENSQRARDNDRRRILENELETERRNLEQARKDLAEQEGIRSGNERNYQRVLDRLQPYQDKVALHERNIEAIEKELAKLR